VDVNGNTIELSLEEKSLCFTYCQVPVLYKLADKNTIEVVMKTGAVSNYDSLSLDVPMSQKVFGRTGEIVRIVVYLDHAGFI
jgi:hypothetical protein